MHRTLTTIERIHSPIGVMCRTRVNGRLIIENDDMLTAEEEAFVSRKDVYAALLNGIITLAQAKELAKMSDQAILNAALKQQISFVQAQELAALKQRDNVVECALEKTIATNRYFQQCTHLGLTESESKILVANFSFSKLNNLVNNSTPEYISACRKLGMGVLSMFRLQDILPANYLVKHVLKKPQAARFVRELLGLNEVEVANIKNQEPFNLNAAFRFNLLTVKRLAGLNASQSRFLGDFLISDKFAAGTADTVFNFNAEYTKRNPIKEDQRIINLVAALDKYIARINSYANLETGFVLFKKSRAASRKANLQLAQNLRSSLVDFDGNDAEVQTFITQTLNVDLRKMHSSELNSVISKAKAGQFAELVLEAPSRKRKLGV